MGFDAFACADAQASDIVFRGVTPGLAVGESVVLGGGQGGAQYFLPEDGRTYLVTLRAVISGRLRPSGDRATRTLLQSFTVKKDAGTATVVASDTVVTKGDAGASDWTIAASTGTGHLAFTFSSGTSRAQCNVACHLMFEEVIVPMDSPLEIDDCTLWLESNRGVTNTSGAVSTWADQSGAGNDFTQATAGSRPTYVANQVGGNYALRFDGVDDKLGKSSGTLADLIASDQYTAFVVAKFISVVGGNADPTTNECAIADTGGKWGYGPVTTAVTYGFHTDATNTKKATGSINAGGVSVVAWSFDATYLRTQYFARSPPISAGNPGSRAGSVLIGANFDSTKFANMDLYEVLVFNRILAESESAQIIAYLNNKYLPLVAYEDPSGIDSTHLKAWYRADLGVTVASGLVSALADQSGTGDTNKNTTAAGGLQPGYTACSTRYGNRPVLTFNGSQELEGPADWAAPQSGPATHYMVAEQDTGAASYMAGGNVASRQSFIQDTGNKFSIYAGTGFVDATATTLLPHVVCAIFDGASSKIFADESGTEQASGNAGSGQMQRTTIGGLTGGVGGRMTGKLAEYIIYSGAHDATTRGRVMNYLKKRYPNV